MSVLFLKSVALDSIIHRSEKQKRGIAAFLPILPRSVYEKQSENYERRYRVAVF